MNELLLMVGVFAGASILGYWLIRRVPQLLHTPLMSMTNAISAVTLLGGLLLFAGEPDTLEIALGGLALAAAAFNLVGGFAITDRILGFFRKG